MIHVFSYSPSVEKKIIRNIDEDIWKYRYSIERIPARCQIRMELYRIISFFRVFTYLFRGYIIKRNANLPPAQKDASGGYE